jgi:hypothetical protein
MHNVSPKVYAAVDTKLSSVVESVVDHHPEIFPNPQQFDRVDNLPGVIALTERIPKPKWEEWQTKWIQTVEPVYFFPVLSNNYACAVSPSLDSMITERFTSIMEAMLAKQPSLPPVVIVLDKTPGFPSLRLLSRIDAAVWEEWQMKWVQTVEPAHLLKAMSEKRLNLVSDAVRSEIQKRLPDLVELTILNHPEIFPSAGALEKIDGLPTKKTLWKSVSPEKWQQWQIEWIKKSSDEYFLSFFLSSRLKAFSSLVEDEKIARIRDIFVTRLAAMPVEEAISFCSRTTLRSYVPNLDQILGITSAMSPDQTLVTLIGLDSTKRESWIAKLIETRLEQLWFFRELVTLAKVHKADFASIVSFASHSLPERLNALLPEIITDHVLLEEMEKGPQRLEARVILLSVLQWLSPERAANLINNVAASTQEGAEVIFTYPSTHLINPKAADALRQSGFALEQVGQLCLCPVGLAGAEAAKLEQLSNVAILRRLATSSTIDILDLFIRPAATQHVPEGQVANGATYPTQALQTAVPSLVLHEPTAILVDGIRPTLTGVELGTKDNGILFLGDGKFTVLAGFNMHPAKAGLAEVEGKTVSQGVLNAVSAIATGKPADLSVPTDLAGKYADFLHAVRTSGDLAARTIKGRIRN